MKKRPCRKIHYPKGCYNWLSDGNQCSIPFLIGGVMDCLIKPSFVTRPYNPAHCVAIRDRWQQFLYIKHGARPLDIYVD